MASCTLYLYGVQPARLSRGLDANLTCSFSESWSYGLGVKSVWTRARPQKGPVYWGAGGSSPKLPEPGLGLQSSLPAGNGAGRKVTFVPGQLRQCPAGTFHGVWLEIPRIHAGEEN